MGVFEAEVNGATYWVAASNTREAINSLLESLDDEGFTDFDSFSIEEATAKRAEAVQIRDDGTDMSESASNLAFNAKETAVLGCSEWP